MSARGLLCAASLLIAAHASVPARQLPLEPFKDAGLGVTAAFEGWYENADGTFSLLVGYFNRNQKQALDIPIGTGNRIEPGGPDRGQPTHFLPRRQWGVFAIVVPKDFGDAKLTWTLSANGQTTSVPLSLNPLYVVEPLKDMAQGNTPPVLRFERGGTAFQGPPRGIAATLSASVNTPLPLRLWAEDDAIVDPDRKAGDAPVTIKWSKYRGPGDVTFGEAQPKVAKEDGAAATTAAFSAPGEYVLRAQANDVSGEGGGGFQCCWTNAHVRVQVSGSTTTGGRR